MVEIKRSQTFKEVVIRDGVISFQRGNGEQYNKFCSIFEFGDCLNLNGYFLENKKTELRARLSGHGLTFNQADYLLEQMRISVLFEKQRSEELFNSLEIVKQKIDFY